MPHPKKFSHVDINKRFLGKNSATSSTSQTPSASGVSKPGSAIQKPVLQTTPSHSRLVTAKLTADPQRSTTTGPGWSRPSSTSSSIAQTPSIATNPKPTPVPPPVTGSVVPQLVPIGRKDSTGKPAWTHSKASASLMGGSVQNDFPTAAEVAQVRSAKLQEKKEAAQAAAAQKEALAAEADAFRGVHLAPNAHHWDEDEGDDSNFLDEVIQFDDGRHL
ncbi:hypothetical protein EW026_g368 [Hermanssonia centrifuga]|uniref:Uncharacterized protein n=1 Tax=Hermanssonia centrifuga TaxID=98765 RepID=A0A4S4KWI3_9APHY|nr:hypothetical protein EW026_g368 [Hermanssonia centrifuga]